MQSTAIGKGKCRQPYATGSCSEVRPQTEYSVQLYNSSCLSAIASAEPNLLRADARYKWLTCATNRSKPVYVGVACL